MPDKQELDQVYQVINKLDTAIDKLADVSSDIKQILAAVSYTHLTLPTNREV